MKVTKGLKFRIYPTKPQQKLLAVQFGHCRFVYNYFLAKKIELFNKDKTKLSCYDAIKELPQLKKAEGTSWLKEASSVALQQSLIDLDSAYINFFRTKKGYPKFKSKYGRQSYRILTKPIIKDNRLYIPNFRKDNSLKIVLDRTNIGKIRNVTISKTTTGKYFASLCCEVEHTAYKKTGNKVGIDTGIKDLAILSTGYTYPNKKPLKRALKCLKFEQRKLSRKVKGTNSRGRQRVKLARVYERVTNIRNYYLQEVTTAIVKNHDVVIVEDLAVKNMIKNHNLAQALSDVALGSFYRMLEYKCEWNDKVMVKVDRFYPSSKTCSDCGHIYKGLTLSMRKWQCSECKTAHDRDFNAATNILNQGIKILSGCMVQSDIKQKQGEALPLGESMKLEASG